jgi:excisionase family DNA binding protein
MGDCSVKPSTSTDLIAPVEAAELLCVDPKTVGRWASAGKINVIRTPGGHRRFLRSEILAILAVDGAEGTPPPTERVDVSSFADHGEHNSQRRDEQGEAARWAAFRIAEAVMLAARSEAAEAAADVARTAAAATAAAETAAAAAERARQARTLAAEEVADATAADAARTAAEVKLRADTTARDLGQSISDAAALVLAAHQLGDEREDPARALQLASTAVQAAVAAAEESAVVAAEVARAVAAAAAAVAMRVSAFDAAIESEVARVAAALQVTATAQARDKAAETETRARAKAVVAREAARAVRRRAIDLEQPVNGAMPPVPSPGYALVDQSGPR